MSFSSVKNMRVDRQKKLQAAAAFENYCEEYILAQSRDRSASCLIDIVWVCNASF